MDFKELVLVTEEKRERLFAQKKKNQILEVDSDRCKNMVNLFSLLFSLLSDVTKFNKLAVRYSI